MEYPRASSPLKTMLMIAFFMGLLLVDLAPAGADIITKPKAPVTSRENNLRQLGNKNGANHENNQINRQTIENMFVGGDDDNENSSNGNGNNRDLIVNGRGVGWNDMPLSMVFLSDRNDDLMCGGTLISHRIVLAAAHCQISLVTHAVFRRNAHPHDRDRFGMGRNSMWELRIAIETEIIHPEYDPSTLENDVMLLVLEESPNNYTLGPYPNAWDLTGDIPYMKLHTPDMPSIDEIEGYFYPDDDEDVDGAERDTRDRWDSQNYDNPITTPLELVALGWGHEWNGEDSSGDVSQPSEELRQVTLNYVTNRECRRAETHISATYSDKIKDTMMCTWSDDKDTCHGDSGGPLMLENPWYEEDIASCTQDCDGIFRYIQVGIISWGEDCADEVFPGVSTRVSEAFDFIYDRVCSIDGDNAPGWFECLDEHTYSPVPSQAPTTHEYGQLEKPPTMPVGVDIFLDVYAEETSWGIFTYPDYEKVYTVASESYEHEQKVRKVFDLEAGATYSFEIRDQFGDGITNKGYYRVFVVDDTQYRSVGQLLARGAGDFGSSDSMLFTVPDLPEVARPIDEVTSRIKQNSNEFRESKKRNRIGQLRGEGILP